ncbi:MAG: Na(+)-translocating NADH-quinone reductase subunit A [Bacteroidales bacterium]|nr:Na(+)-translocating NADH-quinone reductase subunit A [Bacteroidales bacterium]
MSKSLKLRKGLDIRIKGTAEKILDKPEFPKLFGLRPTDFQGLVPKLTVKEGAIVKAGDPLFFDKRNPDILFTSPVSGTVASIVRGERRKILEVTVKPDSEISYASFAKGQPSAMQREEVIQNLLKSGVWPLIRQRPYGIIANPADKPKAIFVSGFDSSPLAPDMDYVLKEYGHELQIAFDALKKLTDGKVYLTLNGKYEAAKVFSALKGVEINYIQGPHPAGNVGVQIHHINPINKGEVIWTVNPQDLVIIGKLFDKGVFDASRIIALTGSEVKTPRYYRTFLGASIESMVLGNVSDGNLRYISGNVLSGTKISAHGFIGFYDSQITVIPEGDYYEFFGWANPGFSKFSTSRTFFTWLSPRKKYRIDTNLKGGERAFVMTGEYERVLPMDILPQFLIKAVMVKDIDKMEQLGIYEVVEEDLALCEFVCTSKIEVQHILREGLQLMIKELS